MGSDLFGSYAESSCAALVVTSISSFGINHDFTAMLFPLLISSMGILVCLITSLFATDISEIKAVKEGDRTGIEKPAYYLNSFHDCWNRYCLLDWVTVFLDNLQLWYTETCEKLVTKIKDL